MSDEDYCELCDLPKSQCIHGNPPAPPPPRATARTATPRASRPVVKKAAPTRTVPRRWTPPDAFKADIVAVLEDAGGELEQEDLFRALEARVAERLTEADHQTTPEGELRWRYAARRARQALITDGAMVKGRPGVWSLG
ncbi:hypothetical protein [Nocardioides aquiterrae]|uniref:Restriction system protein Mrr-like N-terminal domain-containing protein n=1 Tax=Nocardioides aquiterrae TaxID=203799 RepID=A0ABP4EZC5_9ACTN